MQLKKDIVAARASGKCWHQIVETIKNAGFDVSGAYIRAIIKGKTRKTVDEKEKKLAYKAKKTATIKNDECTEVVKSVAERHGQNVYRPDTVDL